MRIGLNLLFLIPGEVGGTQTYTINLIEALSEIDTLNEYILFINKESQPLRWPDKKNFQIISCPIHARNRPWRIAWEQSFFIKYIKDYRVEILHSLGFISPLLLNLPTIVTIHDLNYIFIPQSFTLPERLAQKFLVEKSILRVDHIVAVSQFTKNQIIQYLGTPPEKITVTLEAAKRITTAINNNKIQLQEVWDKFHVRHPYIITISNINPHKNMQGLLKAYYQACESYELNAQLVIVGHLPHGFKSEFPDLFFDLDKRVITTGYLEEKDLLILFSGASLFVFPSLYEGFGLPVLEAMQLGVPVTCSNRGSIPEVAGSAAVYFDPEDISQMAITISSLMQNKDKREQLIRLGHDQASHFDWLNTARDTLSVYKKVINSKYPQLIGL